MTVMLLFGAEKKSRLNDGCVSDVVGNVADASSLFLPPKCSTLLLFVWVSLENKHVPFDVL